MTLTNKIILLVGFIVLSSAIVFYWFTQRLFQQMDSFQRSMATQREQLEDRFSVRVDDLQHKREQLSEEVETHLNRMESELAKNQEKAEEFHREFLKGQNEVFEAIGDFNAGKTVR